MKVLVLGGFGFIGKSVVQELERRGHAAQAASRRGGLDARDADALGRLLATERPQAIINCAAHVGSIHYHSQNAATVVDDNLQMVLSLYRAVQATDAQIRVVNPISNCAYPGAADIQTETAFWDGPVHSSVWPFANAKRMLLVVSQCYATQHGVPTTNLIVPNAYGPGDYTDPNLTHAFNGMIIRMLQAKARGDAAFEIWGTGKPTREWIYGPDMGRVLVDALEREPAPDPLNVAQNHAYSIADTAAMIRDAIAFPGELTFNTRYQDGAATKQLGDERFRRAYPDFRFTDIRDGIAATVAYYKSELGVA